MKSSPHGGVAADTSRLALRLPSELARALGDTGGALLLLAALLVAWRRLAGALSQPGEPAALLACALLAIGLAAGFRFACGAAERPRWTAALPSVALLALAVSLSLPGSGLAGLAALWAPIVALESWAAWRFWLRRGRAIPRRRGRPTAELLDSAMGMIAAATMTEPSTDGDLTQQFMRSRSADGCETLSGWLRLAFAPGQRQATAHLAFCPPFDHAPLLEVRQADGPTARVKTAQLLAYGARLDVKLSAPADSSLTIRLEFSARAPALPGEPRA